MILVLCGSVREYGRAMSLMCEHYTMCGWTVLMPDLSDRIGKDKGVYTNRHKRLINLASKVIVLSDERGRMGESVTEEFIYACEQNKDVEIITMSK